MDIGDAPGSRTQSVQPDAQAGLSLVEVLVASVVALAIVAALLRGLSGVQFSVKKASAVFDQSTIRTMLLERVDCRQTLPANSPPCAAGSYVNLVDGDGRELVPIGGAVIGGITVRARCATGGLDVRTADLTTQGNISAAALMFDGPQDPQWYVRDPSNPNLRLNWVHPRAQLFAMGVSGAPGGLCSERFVTGSESSFPATSCDANEILLGVDFYRNTVQCAPMPASCPAQTALSWNGSAFTCVTSPHDATIRSKVQQEVTELQDAVAATPWECVTAQRQGSGSISGGGGFVGPWSNGGDGWGMTCLGTFRRTGCFLGQEGSAFSATHDGRHPDWDWDVDLTSNGCQTGGEEKSANASLTITCCRQGVIP